MDHSRDSEEEEDVSIEVISEDTTDFVVVSRNSENSASSTSTSLNYLQRSSNTAPSVSSVFKGSTESSVPVSSRALVPYNSDKLIDLASIIAPLVAQHYFKSTVLVPQLPSVSTTAKQRESTKENEPAPVDKPVPFFTSKRKIPSSQPEYEKLKLQPIVSLKPLSPDFNNKKLKERERTETKKTPNTVASTSKVKFIKSQPRAQSWHGKEDKSMVRKEKKDQADESGTKRVKLSVKKEEVEGRKTQMKLFERIIIEREALKKEKEDLDKRLKADHCRVISMENRLKEGEIKLKKKETELLQREQKVMTKQIEGEKEKKHFAAAVRTKNKELKEKEEQLMKEQELFKKIQQEWTARKSLGPIPKKKMSVDKSTSTDSQRVKIFREQGTNPEPPAIQPAPPNHACWRCLEPGHVRRDCPIKEDPVRLCFRCGRRGYTVKTCPMSHVDSDY